MNTPVITIGIDVSRAVEMNPGTRRYVLGLIKGFTQLESKTKFILYPFFFRCFPPGFKEFKPALSRGLSLRWNLLPEFLIKKLWFHPRIKLRWKLGPIDLLHSTAFTVPPVDSLPLIVTVLDLSFISHPECHFQANIDFCMEQVQLLKHGNAHVIAISNYTKRDLVEEIGLNPSRISCTPLAVDHEKFSPQDKSRVNTILKKHGIQGEYVLFVGSIEPRKNISVLIQVFKKLVEKKSFNGVLVIAGGPGWKNEAILELPSKLGVNTKVIFIKKVSDEDLRALYTGAKLFIYPSLCEGFGLPVLEAMACGAPVIASNNSAIPEVVGDAGILVDPLDENELFEKTWFLLSDSKARKEFKLRGLERAKQFTWKKTARLTMETYTKVFETNR